MYDKDDDDNDKSTDIFILLKRDNKTEIKHLNAHTEIVNRTQYVCVFVCAMMMMMMMKMAGFKERKTHVNYGIFRSTV